MLKHLSHDQSTHGHGSRSPFNPVSETAASKVLTKQAREITKGDAEKVWTSELTTAQILYQFTGASGGTKFLSINKELRGTTGDSYKLHEREIRGLDEVFARPATHLPVDVVTYRAFSARIVQGLKVGDVFTDKGFVSTTLRKSFVEEQEFGWHAFNKGGTLNAEIRLRQGQKAVYVDPITRPSQKQREYEVLLPRDSKFRVVESSESSLVLEVL